MDTQPSPSSLPVAVAPPKPSSEERMWALLSHLGPILIGFVAPLVVMLTKGNESAFVRRHAVEALNFNLTLLGALIVSMLLTFVAIGCVLLPVVFLGGLVLQIIAGVKANGGEEYRYPVNLRVIH